MDPATIAMMMKMFGGGGGSNQNYGGMASAFGGGLSQFLGGLFGNTAGPYKDAAEQMQKYFQGAQGFQNPFFQAGTGAIPGMQDWLKKMSDPTKFINDTQSQYQQSPYNKFLQDQASKGAVNVGSATGMTGSTPMMQQMQQNSANIGQQGMNDWMGNVMNANTQYGQGLNNMMGYGQHAGDMLSNMFSQMGQQMGSNAYNQGVGDNTDSANTWQGLLKMFGL